MTIDDVPSTLDFYDELALLCNSRFSEMHATYWVKKLAWGSSIYYVRTFFTFSDPPTYYVSIKIVLNISNNCHFLPTHPVLLQT
jgi:hypothetical protein